MCDKRGDLEVEVIRARGLQSKAGSKVLPAPWVKVYLVSGKKCLAKAKTAPARRTLDPLFQQQLVFHERYGGCVLQVPVFFLFTFLLNRVTGDGLGRLRTGGGQEGVHGCGSDHAGRPRSIQHCHRMVTTPTYCPSLKSIIICSTLSIIFRYKLFGTSSLVSVPPGGGKEGAKGGKGGSGATESSLLTAV